MQFIMVVVISAHLPTEHSLYVPRTRTTLGDRSFAVAGPRALVRNSLPATNSLRQTVHTHCASVHQAAKLVAALLRRKVMAAYRRVYD